MRKIISIIIGLQSTFASAGQHQMSIPQFLALVHDRQENKIYQESIDKTREQPRNLPLFEKAELRTDVDNLNSLQLDYALRISTNGIKEKAHQRQVFREELRQAHLDHQVSLQTSLRDHYQLLVDIIYLPQLNALKQELFVVLGDKISVLEQLLENNFGPDVSDLIEAEYDQSQLELEILELTNIIGQNQEIVEELSAIRDTIVIDTTNLIDIETMIFTSQMNMDLGTSDNVYYAAREQEIKMAEQETLAEKLKTRNPLSYFQIGYDGSNNDLFSETISLGIGIKLPGKGSGRIKILESSRKEMETKRELELYVLESEERQREIIRGFEAIYLKYFLLKKQEKEDKARKILEQYLKVEGISPLTLLKLNEIILKRKIQMLSFQHQIYQRYIELHDVLGKLAKVPLRNYLSEDLERF